MFITRRLSQYWTWLAVEPKSGRLLFGDLIECVHEQSKHRLKTFDSVEEAELFIANSDFCTGSGSMEICEVHFFRDAMQLSISKSLSR